MISTLTLNPAIDKVLFLNKVEKGVTNRVYKQTENLGGKGTHVSVNLRKMGIANQAFGVAHGGTGRSIIQALSDCGVVARFVVREVGRSRINYILIEEDNTCTTIAEKGVTLDEGVLDELLELMRGHIGQNDYLVLSGDASNCPDAFVYNRIASELQSKNIRILLDTSGEALAKGLKCSPYLIKPNQTELEELCGFPIVTDDDVIRGMRSLECYSIEVIAVSQGEKGSIAQIGGEYYKAVPPDVSVRNTAGCGDSFLAGLLYGHIRGMTPVDMLRHATAVSAATAASQFSVGYNEEYAESLIGEIEVRRI